MDKTPCYNCQERCLLCHSRCVRYHTWVARQKARRKAIQAAKAKDNDVNGFMVDQPDRIRAQQQAQWQARNRGLHRKG